MVRASRPLFALSPIVAASLTLAAPPLLADTLTVPGDSATIQGAILLASSGDTIQVAPGTYFGAISFLGKQLVIESTGGAAVTTIFAFGGGSVVTVDGAEPAGTALRGFTLTGGTGQHVEMPDGFGGIYDALGGGGVYVGPDAHLDLSDCVITGNGLAWGPFDTWGGGIFTHLSTVTVTDCTLSGNVAEYGAAFGNLFAATHLELSGCTITGNASNQSAVVSLGSGSGSVTHCLIAGNTGDGLEKAGYGATVTHCTFQGNTGWGYRHFANAGGEVDHLTFLGNGLGGAFCFWGFRVGSFDRVFGSVFAAGDTLSISNPNSTIDRCTFDGASIDCNNLGVALRSSIVRGAGSLIDSVQLTVSYSDIEGGFVGVGNIDADALWVNAATHDYHLLPASPCIDAGDPSSPLDPDGTRADMGAIPFENAFDDLGGGVAGSAGLVVLTAHGTLLGGEGVDLELTGTPPLQPVVLILGTAPLGAPFKGGTLWPSPGVLIDLLTNGAGQLTLSTTWPPAIPSGFKLFAQSWYPDAGAIAGFAGSNGVRGTVP